MVVVSRRCGGWLLTAVILVIGPWLVAAQPIDNEARVSTSAIEAADQAVELALEYSGFDRAEYKREKPASEMASKVIVTKDKTPFFHDRIVDKELWVVTFDSVYVEIPKLMPEMERKQKPKTYDIYLDPETGYLLKIESRWDGHDSTLSEEPPADIGAEDMSKNGIAYLDFVKVIPEVDFYHALQIAPECYAANAKQIIAHLVISDQGGVIPALSGASWGEGLHPSITSAALRRQFLFGNEIECAVS